MSKKPEIVKGQKLITHSGEELMFIDWIKGTNDEDGAKKLDTMLKVTGKDRGIFPISINEIREIVEIK